MLYIVSAPSGAGKSSLIQALLTTKLLNNIQLSISHTTRAMRPGETNGQHYFFVPVTKFERMISENAFLEYAYIFGNYYGTSYEVIAKILNKGVDVFLDIDWQGAKQIRSKIKKTCSIFILPPSKEELDRRLQNRGHDSLKMIRQRIAQAMTEITHSIEYDYLIVNDNFNTALSNLETIVLAERLRFRYQKSRYNALISKLLKD